MNAATMRWSSNSSDMGLGHGTCRTAVSTAVIFMTAILAGRGLFLRSLSLELVQRDVVNPHRAGRLDDEPEVDLVRVAGVEHESILAPPGSVLDVGASR